MTQEEKELLLKDLCARLRYGVVYHRNDGANIKLNEIDVDYCRLNYTDDIEERVCKPYLRPMSSMTTQEEFEYHQVHKQEEDMILDVMERNNHLECLMLSITAYQKSIDWLNAHHFDYRRLIEKGLALEAPEEMYN